MLPVLTAWFLGGQAVLLPVRADVAQEAYLKASNTDADDDFGRAVAIDGDTMVIGASGEAGNGTGGPSNNSMAAAGAAYVFVRSGSGWVQQAYLKASNPTAGDVFGAAVAISGNTIVVSARREDSSNLAASNESAADSGAAYVFVRTGTTWTQQAILKAQVAGGAANINAGDEFGYWVDIDADTIAVGARYQDTTATDSGAAYVYTRSGSTWTIQQRLKAPSAASTEEFGAVALAGDTLVVGNPGRDTAGTNNGAAHVYTRSGTTWTHRAVLLPSGGGLNTNHAFGEQVALSGNTVAIRASLDDAGGTDSGAVYVFTGSGATWTLQQKLKASNPGADDEFGRSVALEGDVLVAGAPNEDSSASGINGDQGNNNSADSGAAYVFTRTGTTWSQTAYLKASNPGSGDLFGYVGGVGISGSRVVVGAYREDGGATGVDGHESDDSQTNAGAAYLFHLDAPPDIRVESPAGFSLRDGVDTVPIGDTVQAVPITRSLLLKNAGGQPLVIGGWTATAGFDCPDLAAPLTLAPGAVHNLTVRFLANQPSGPATGTLTLSSNDPDDESDFSLTLAGYARAGGPGADFDTLFGNGGGVTTAVGAAGDFGVAVAVQNDGKIVVAGRSRNGTHDDFAVVRYLPDGTLDTGFGTGGKVTTDIAGGDDFPVSVLIQSDGKIVVAGYSWNGSAYVFSLVRHTTAGALDTSYSGDGKVTAAIGSGADYAGGAALQGDDKVVVVGQSWNGSVYAFSAARFTTAGALDTSFSSDGKVVTSMGSSDAAAWGCAVQTDGRIVLAGSTYISGNAGIAMARYTAAGALDTSFGSGGRVLPASTASQESIGAIAIQPDGRIVIAGGIDTDSGTGSDFFLARYTASGAPDTSFGGGGAVVRDGFDWDDDTGFSVAIQPDGKIAVGGRTAYVGYNHFGLMRVLPDGTPDEEFGYGGLAITSVGEASSGCYGIALQRDGRIVAAGYAQVAGQFDFAVVRYGADILPAVLTGEATDVTASAAVLSGTVNPQGIATTGWIEYGPTPAYGQSTAVQSVGYGTTPVPISASLSGLTPLTTYHYRLAGQNGSGTVYGTGSTFTTAGFPDIAVLDGNHAGAPELTHGQTTPLNVGYAGVGGPPASRVFTVKNMGPTPLSGLAMSFVGPQGTDFSADITGMASTVAPGASTSFAIGFQPGAVGSRSATLQIASNDPDENPFLIPLAGVGRIFTAPPGQQIVANAVPVKRLGDAPFSLEAYASSGLPLTYAVVAGPATVSPDGVVTLSGTEGAVTVRLGQAGGSGYEPVEKFLTFHVAGAGYARVSSGMWHTMAIRADGTLWGRGDNSFGQLGDGTTINRPDMTRIGTGTDWAHVSAGWYYTMAIRTDGTLWGWGRNDGNLGTGNFVSSLSPMQIGTAADWAFVSAGTLHTVAVKTDGTLWSWGSNGVIGDGTSAQRLAPFQLGTANDWATASAGEKHTLAVKTNGTLWAWGENIDGKLGDGTTVTRLSPVQIGTANNWSTAVAAEEHSAALRTDGSLWTWGRNWYGELGDGTTTNRPAPTRVGSGTNWTAVALSRDHTMALRAGGSLWVWGTNEFGQLPIDLPGLGYPIINARVPYQIADVSGLTALSTSVNYSTAVRADGSLLGWGLGVAGAVCRPLSPLWPTKWSSVSAGSDYAVGIRPDGTLWAWGSNDYGKLGDGSTAIRRSQPVQIGPSAQWIGAAAGFTHTAAIRDDGTLWLWGNNGAGQLGDGTTISRRAPVQVGSANDWRAVSLGDSHSMALRADGTLWGWGYNSNGQLGDGTNTLRNTPTQIGNASDWAAVSAGFSWTVALKTDGTLWSWGLNMFGYLGDGTTISRNSPGPIAPGSTWKTFSTSGTHALAVKSDGSLWAWGKNDYGALGNGTGSASSIPIRIGTDSDWAAVSAGQGFSAATKVDGTLWTWGHNLYGQLGDRSKVGRLVPARVGQSTAWASAGLDAGREFLLVLARDGTVWGCGENQSSQVGSAGTYIWGPNLVSPARAAQEVTFPLPDLSINQPVPLSAVATGGRPVTYGVEGPAVLVGQTVMRTGFGTVHVLAWQPGDETWETTEPVRRSHFLAATETRLMGLTLSHHPMLTPAFSPTWPSYTAPEVDAFTQITVSAMAWDPNSTVTVNGMPVPPAGTPASAPVPLAYGTNALAIVCTAQDGVTTRTYTINLRRLTPIESWRKTHFGTPDQTGEASEPSDPDRDGVSNLVEYAFGLQPHTGDAALLPAWTVQGGEYVMTFAQPAGVENLTYIAEWSVSLSNDPADWTALPDTGTPPQHRFAVPMADQSRLFLRVRVESTPP